MTMKTLIVFCIVICFAKSHARSNKGRKYRGNYKSSSSESSESSESSKDRNSKSSSSESSESPNYGSTIRCGETKTGYRSRGQDIEYRFISNGYYGANDVYLDGCDSDYDMVLKIRDSSGSIIETADDDEKCYNPQATSITFPDSCLPLNNGDIYTFIVSGFKAQDIGDYSVTLFCGGTAPTTPQRPISPSPTTSGGGGAETTTPPLSPSCGGRHREAWHLISDAQRLLFINGFKQLSRDGKLGSFTESHSRVAQHGTARFLPWHRYFIYQFETEIRNLGGDYECFSLPYWDWAYEIGENEYNIASYHILSEESGLGGNGDPNMGNCVSGNFAPNEYTPSSGGCLRRNACDPRTDANQCYGESSASDLMGFITSDSFYGDDDERNGGYRSDLEGNGHDWAHVHIGGDGGQLSNIDISPDDPIFYLLHSFVDYQWSLWQDCRNYELQDISNNNIIQTIFGVVSDLDMTLEYGALQRAPWSSIPVGGVSVRSLHSIDFWGVSYDEGDFFDMARVEDNSLCGGNINPAWFQQRRRLASGYKRNPNRKKSECQEYSEDIFTKLHSRVGGKGKSKEQNADLYKTWAQMNCQFATMENKCERPKYFDDCSDMELVELNKSPSDYDIGNGYSEITKYRDIDITLDELIEKVSDYSCMVETRKKYYQFAKDRGNLIGLCRGQYDNFCNKDFKKEKGADKCLAKLNKKQNGNNGKNKDKGYTKRDVTY